MQGEMKYENLIQNKEFLEQELEKHKQILQFYSNELESSK